ncbi:BMP family ABC transporter substrate-binding protein [Nocardioides coralli]|nr:BMP family ABC transporter substrate-binding protein [Nocardioides coralli]
MKKIVGTAAVAALTLTLAACGERSEESPGAAEEIDFKACMVSDSGGFDDKSFNQTSRAGLSKAEDELGVQTATIESASDAEYEDNIQSLVDEGCDQITTVGFLLGDATRAAAEANPDTDFAIVDFAFTDPETFEPNAPDNAKGLTFDTGQPSFLAGYVAAATSESGKVGTFGGLNIPTVTIFMTGFLQGVEYYNEETGEDVQVIGWNGKSGSFTEDFEDQAKGQQVAEQMIQQGADVIFPVAGPAGLGGLKAAQDNDAFGIWVDTDGCVSASEYCDVLLTSVLKAMDVAVASAIEDSVNDEFTNEVYQGTLENDGVGLADLGDQVPAEVADKVEELRQMIIDGEITVG